MTRICTGTGFRPGRGIILSLFVWLCMAVAAHAHASLQTTEPRDGAVVALPPAAIRLVFSEPVAPTRLLLTAPDGSSSALDRFEAEGNTIAVTPPGAMAEGTYLLSWRVVSEDGHPVGGTMVFSVGRPDGVRADAAGHVDWTIRAGLWLGRIGIYVGLFLGIGGVFAMHAFCRGSRAAVRPAAVFLGLGLAGTLVSAGFQGLDTIGAPFGDILAPVTWRAGLATSFGRTAIVMTVALAIAGMTLAGKGRPASWTALLALLAGASALSLSGHASTAEPRWLMRAAVLVHVLGVAVWAGALVPLALEFRSARADAAASLLRFSRSIPYVIAGLAGSGIVLAVVQVRTLPGLWTDYGTVLLVKLGLLVPLFGLAAFNRWRLTSGALRGEPAATARLIRTILTEILLVLIVLGVAASWRFTPPPRTLVAERVEATEVHLHGDAAMAVLTLRPEPDGRTTIEAAILGADFSPLAAQEVSIALSNPAAGIEPIRRQATGGGAAWTVRDIVLPLAGPWTVRVDVVVDDFSIHRLDGEIDVKR